MINDLYSVNNLPHHSAQFEQPIKAFSIDPSYSTNNARRFVIGVSDRLLFYEKNLIGRYKVSCLQQARGVIRNTSWNRNFIVWSSDLCLKIYDATSRTIITHLDREKESDYHLKLDLYQCNVSWKNDRTLLIAWGNSIKICNIILRSHESQISLSSVVVDRQPRFYVELVYSFNIDHHLIACGIASFNNRLMILCANKSLLYPTLHDKDELHEKKSIRIKMVEPKNADLFTDISDDILAPNEFLKTVQKSRDISLHYSPDNFYLILCPKDLIVAKPREEDDSIDWLLRRGKFKEAFLRTRSNPNVVRYNSEEVGKMYIKHLLDQKTSITNQKAAKICQMICQDNSQLWESQINFFKQYQCLRSLREFLPIEFDNPSQTLDNHLYEMILNEFAEFDSEGFLNLIRTWPPELYSISAMINQTINRLASKSEDRYLLEALAELYTIDRRYQKALFTFLQVGNTKKVFDLIWKHQLLHLLEDRIVELLRLDPEETSRLLISNHDTISSEKIIAKLQGHPKLLCAYLDRLISKDPTAYAQHHDLLFDLYAEQQPEKIVSFLRQSNYIQLDKALEVCRKRNLTKAVVFILGRMGNTQEALRMILDKMDDINAAIEFCKEHGDTDLWTHLMDISVSKPRLLSKLLSEVGTHAADPIGMIARIPEGLEVPDLIPSLVRILQDYRLMVTLEDGCRRVFNADCYNLFKRLHTIRSRAISVRDPDRHCHSCQSESGNQSISPQ